MTSAEASERLASSDLERAKQLAEKGAISARALEKAVTDLDTAHAAVEQAKANLALRQSELASAEAHLIQPSASGSDSGKRGLLRAGDVADQWRRAQAPGRRASRWSPPARR